MRAALLTAVFCSIVLAACDRRPPAELQPSGTVLHDKRAAGDLAFEVDAWAARIAAEPPANGREKAEQVAAELRGSLARARAAAARGAGGRAYRELRHDFDAAIASIDSERRAVEALAAETLASFDDDIAAFRVQISSVGAQANGEARRRLLQLERGRREAAATLADLRRVDPALWGPLRRRWQEQVRDWRRAYREASARLPAIRTAPSPQAPADPSAARRPA